MLLFTYSFIILIDSLAKQRENNEGQRPIKIKI